MTRDNNKKTHYVVLGGKGGGQAESVDWNDILNKPEFAAVATTGDYDDLTDKPTILTQWFGTQAEYDAIVTKDPNVIYNIEGSDNVQADWNQSDSTADDYIKNKPTIPAAQVNSDWNSNSGVSQILNKPSLATVATSGNYSDLNGTPTLATVATSGDYDDLQNKPTIPTVPTNVSAFTNDTGYTTFDGDYNSLTNKPTIPAAQVNSDWNASTGVSQILNKPNLATVATSGSYNDLTNKPDLTHYVEDTDLATVATSGSYDDLSNKPTIPAAQVNADWNSTSGVSQILNKPELATVATTGSYNDLTDKPTVTQEQADWSQTDTTAVDYIKNKPEIPSVPPMATESLTFTLQGGTTKTIDFYTVPDYFYVENRTNSNGTFTIKKSAASAPSIQVYSSTDRINWTNMGTTSTSGITISMPANGKTYLKATANNWGDAQLNYNYIKTNYSHNVGGNIMSLLYGDSFVNKTTFPTNNTYVLANLFTNNEKLISAENLILPATTVTENCYNQMFEGCTSLTAAPAILPATTLANSCYSTMFRFCRALTTAPELPATTLANWCYYCMFGGCTSLTTAPVLPAKTLVSYCYNEMFNVCSSLNKITIYANNISASNCIKYWVNGVAATGDFFKLGSASFPSGASGIPSGWTVHTSL